MPRIANTDMKNIKKETRYPIYGSESKSVLTSRFMLGTALMLLRGLKTLMVLRDFRFGT